MPLNKERKKHLPSQLGLQNTLTAFLQRVKTLPHNECPDMTLNNLIVRFQIGECRVPLHCHCRGGHYFFPLIFPLTLDQYFIILSISNEVSSTIFWVLGMTRSGIEPLSPGSSVNHLEPLCHPMKYLAWNFFGWVAYWFVRVKFLPDMTDEIFRMNFFRSGGGRDISREFFPLELKKKICYWIAKWFKLVGRCSQWKRFSCSRTADEFFFRRYELTHIRKHTDRQTDTYTHRHVHKKAVYRKINFCFQQPVFLFGTSEARIFMIPNYI